MSYTALRITGAILTGGLALSGATSLAPGLVRASDVTQIPWPEGTESLRIESDTGQVFVHQDGQPGLQIEKTWSFTPPRQTVTTVDGVTTMKITCDQGPFNRCDSDWDVVVPEGMDVRVHSNLGDVTAEGLTGALDLSSDFGDVRVGGAPESLTATSNLGDIEARLSHNVPMVVLTTDLGQVEATVPGDIAYDLRATTSLGDVRTEGLVIDPDSTYRIEARSNLGDVSVHPG